MSTGSVTQMRADIPSSQFSSQDADVTFRSSDGVIFKLHSVNLKTNTGGTLIDANGDKVIDLTEGSTTLATLFSFIYPARHPDLADVPFTHLRILAEAAEKYRIYSAMNVCKIHMRNALFQHPKEVLVFGMAHGYSDLMDAVAPRLVDIPVKELVSYLPQQFLVPWIEYSGIWLQAFRRIFCHQFKAPVAHPHVWIEDSNFKYNFNLPLSSSSSGHPLPTVPSANSSTASLAPKPSATGSPAPLVITPSTATLSTTCSEDKSRSATLPPSLSTTSTATSPPAARPARPEMHGAAFSRDHNLWCKEGSKTIERIVGQAQVEELKTFSLIGARHETIADSQSIQFNSRDADTFFRSSDGVVFRIHSANLNTNTEGFSIPIGAKVDQVIELTESSETLTVLFRFVYPVLHPDLEDVDFMRLRLLANAAEKYRVFAAMNICKLHMKHTLPQHADEILFYAMQNGYRDVMDAAAPLVLHVPLAEICSRVPPQCIVPWIKYHDCWGQVLQRALRYHLKTQAAPSAPVSDRTATLTPTLSELGTLQPSSPFHRNIRQPSPFRAQTPTKPSSATASKRQASAFSTPVSSGQASSSSSPSVSPPPLILFPPPTNPSPFAAFIPDPDPRNHSCMPGSRKIIDIMGHLSGGVGTLTNLDATFNDGVEGGCLMMNCRAAFSDWRRTIESDIGHIPKFSTFL
ncbi:hypothetical protein DXG01_005324 [Tephrocybe rancida]|nr:hypothetical protein DXG01_005324 [Tephrocybe rancida]